MRRIFLALAALTLCLAASSQTTTPSTSPGQQANGPANIGGILYAANFGHWQVPQGENGGYSWTNQAQCFGVSGGVVFPAFATNAPVTIVDTGNPTNTETVTPTSVLYGGWGCSVALPATHAHKTFYLQSGTAGLQEALNWASATNAVVVVTPDWTTLGGTTSMITSATAGANTSVLDWRTSAFGIYACSAGSCTAAGSKQPTLTLTAAAPTVAASQVGFGSTTAVVSNCGTTGPTACLVINVAGTTHYIPYY